MTYMLILGRQPWDGTDRFSYDAKEWLPYGPEGRWSDGQVSEGVMLGPLWFLWLLGLGWDDQGDLGWREP